MRLIVGLGNFPEKYARTRHNFGFLAVEMLAKKFGFELWRMEKKFFCQISAGELGGEKTLLLKPETLMNLSGKSVAAIANFYKIEPSKIFILSDDVDLPFGEIRFRKKGSAGGHRGIQSIISSLGTSIFGRLKFGISNERRSAVSTEAFVLQKFFPEEWEKIPEILDRGISKLLEHLKC